MTVNDLIMTAGSNGFLAMSGLNLDYRPVCHWKNRFPYASQGIVYNRKDFRINENFLITWYGKLRGFSESTRSIGLILTMI